MTVRLDDPKNLTEWLDLDAHRRPRPLQASKWIPYSLLALFTAAGVLLWGQVSSHTIYQAGPLATRHSLFAHDCQVCHEESFVTLQRFVPGNDSLRSVPDSACLKCHDAQRHQPESVLAHGPSCVSCHREHRGNEALARVADTHCTSCHRDLSAASSPGHQSPFASFAGWPDHPDFRQRWQPSPDGPDPATIRFSHARHLAPEGLPPPADARRPDGQPAAWEKLTCADCHRPDDSGAYMLPVRYDQHCQRCHPLKVPFDPPTDDPRIRLRAELFRQQPAPHQEPLVVRGVLRERLHAFITHPEHQSLVGGLTGDLPRPSILSPWPRPPQASPSQQAFVDDHLRNMERQLFVRQGDGGCGFCHRPAEDRAEGLLPRYLPSWINQRHFPDRGAVDTRWFPHGAFSHKSHRMMDCLECHPGVNEDPASATLHMPAVDNCRQCHNQAGAGGSAGASCVECHLYHPRGAHAPGPWSVRELLDGELPRRE